MFLFSLTVLLFSLGFKQGGKVALCDNQLLRLIPQFPVFSRGGFLTGKFGHEKTPETLNFQGFSHLSWSRLTLRELRSTTCGFEAVLLTLFHSRVAGQKTCGLERGAIALVQDEEGTGPTTDLELIDGYAKWDCPWSLTLNYSLSYGYGTFNYKKLEYNGKWTQNLSLNASIRPTKNWSLSASASYNFDTHKIAYMNCSISRQMHCFEMSASFVPVGPYKSYNFHIAVKSSILQDVKYDKHSSMSNGVTWY